MLKMFVMDLSWRGGIVAIASSEEEAHKIMSEDPDYNEKYTMKSYDIKDGFYVRIHGDD